MLYYDQGMFEEVNHDLHDPAEVMAGGVSINMVTKDGGNLWKGNVRYSFGNDALQSVNHLDAAAAAAKVGNEFLGNPTQKTYDFNLSGGGAIVRNRLWVNGTIRKWVVNKLVNARNLDGSQALDDNDLKNYSGKAVASITPNNKLSFSYLWNNKIRGHRRDTPPNSVPTSRRCCRPTRRRRRRPNTPVSAIAWSTSPISASWTARPIPSPARHAGRRDPGSTTRCRLPTSPRRAKNISRTRARNSTT